MLTILIADDEPHVVELVRLTLEDERINVVEALDGETPEHRHCVWQSPCQSPASISREDTARPVA